MKDFQGKIGAVSDFLAKGPVSKEEAVFKK